MKFNNLSSTSSIVIIVCTTGLMSGCTGQIPGSFRFLQVTENFASSTEINTKLDMLWVIDNSASMDVSQERLREGFSAFASKYMQPTWDIRVAVITTDTYLANSAFTSYRSSNMSWAGSYNSPYMNGRTVSYGSSTVPGRATAFTHAAWTPNVWGSDGAFVSGILVNQEHPQYTANYAKLIPGMHDGPTTTLCWEYEDLYLKSYSKCYIRDAQTANRGPTHCAFPSTGEDSMSQCVNTLMNDTVHTGLPIISTQPPAGVSANQAWTNTLVQNFLVNISTGSSGNGRERGLASVAQLLQDNEGTSSPTAFFRPNALRAIIFVSDEDDQSMDYPTSVPGSFSPDTYFTSCSSKTVDGYTYTVQGQCPSPAHLVPVQNYKDQFDNFFMALDGSTTTPNYFVFPIVLISGTSIQQMHLQRNNEAVAVGNSGQIISDRGDRYIQLANLVGNGSNSMEISSTDYTPILNAIGTAIVEKKAAFQLKRAPTGSEDMIVKIAHANGTSTSVSASDYTIVGKVLTITNNDIVLAMKSTDSISINYQPKTAY